MPDPATRSLTVLDVRTSPGLASACNLAATCTAMPPTSSPISSTSPQCRPTRSSNPSARAASMVAPRHLHIPRAGDAPSEFPAGPPVDDAVAPTVQHEGWNVDRGQDVSHVDVEEHLEDLPHHRGTCGGTLHPCRELHRLGIIRQ